MLFSSLENPLITNPGANGIRAVPVQITASGAGFISNDPRLTIPLDEDHVEREGTAEAHEGSPRHVGSGTLVNEMNVTPPTATHRSRGPILPVDAEDNIARLKSRLLEHGADVEAVKLCDEVFKAGVTKGALQRRLTRDQCRRLRLKDGKQFQLFLEKVEVMGATKNCCRLCPVNDAIVYKKHRDALRHLFKEHFGLWFECTHW